MTRDQRKRRVVRASKPTTRRKLNIAARARVSTRSETYIRFVTSERDDDSRSSRGVFRAAYALHRSTHLEPHEYDWLNETIEWYERNLPVPRYFKRKRTNDMAICWFRVSAQPKIKRLWELVHLLKEYGVFIRTIRAKKVGEFVFQDEYQVVAIPGYRTPR